MANTAGKNVTVTKKIARCNCQSEFQDRTYGLGRRLFKVVKHSGSLGKTEERCTVCFSRPYAFGGNGSLKIVPNWRWASWPAWLPWKSRTHK